MFGDEIRSLDVLPVGASVVIYGCGVAGRTLCGKILQERKDITVCAFADSNKDFWSIFHKPILHVAKIKDAFPEAIVLVASLYFKEITQNLQNNGVQSYYIFRTDVDRVEMSLCNLYLESRKNSKLEQIEALPEIDTSGNSLYFFNIPANAELRDFVAAHLEQFLVLFDKQPNRILNCNAIDREGLSDLLLLADVAVAYVVNLYGDRGFCADFVLQVTALAGSAEVKCCFCPPNIKNMLVVEDLKLAYLPIAKCGSTSTLCTLRSIFEKDFDKTDPHSVQSDRSLVYPVQVDDDFLETYSVFTVVRNPYSRLVSFYNNYCRLKHDTRSVWLSLSTLLHIDSFEKFCEYACSCPDGLADHHFQSQASFLRLADGGLIDATIIKLEEYAHALPAFLGGRVPLSGLEHLNSSKADSCNVIEKYYTPKLLRLCNERYEQDFVHFGYACC